MYEQCLICNSRMALLGKNSIKIFNDSTLSSGKNLSDVVSEIVGKPLKEDGTHSSVLCEKCHQSCTEYDDTQIRLQEIKTQLLDEFKNTLLKHNLNYETYDLNQLNMIKSVSPSESDQGGRKYDRKPIVLPASKLQPLPPNYLVNVGKVGALSKHSIILPKQLKSLTTPVSTAINLRGTCGSSILTQALSTTAMTTKTPQKPTSILTTHTQRTNQNSNVSLAKGNENEEILTVTDVVSRESNLSLPTLVLDSTSVPNSMAILTTSSNSLLNFNVNTLPKDFLSNAVITKIDTSDEQRNDEIKKEFQANEGPENDDHEMEIDEGCTYNTSSSDKMFDEDSEKTSNEGASKYNTDYLEAGVLSTLDSDNISDKYILGKLEVMQDTNDVERADEPTIVMESDDGSILRVMTGDKYVVYENGEISLMLPDGSTTDVDTEKDTPDNDNEDGQDGESNDESQIELQVSGDEETANAIIAAAREKGGAFIKVGSGEMFRVRSVRSQRARNDKYHHIQPIVTYDNDAFKCLLCEKNDETDLKTITTDAEFMMRHLRSVHSARVYICCVCGHICMRKTDYNKHLDTHSSSEVVDASDRAKQLECAVCNKKFNTRTLLTEHMNSHNKQRPYSCHVCHKTFASKYTRQSHLKIHLDRPRPYKCAQCSKSFLTQQNLAQHERTHSSTKDFICKICGKAFGTQYNLEVHGVVHSGQKPFVCTVCNKGFARRAEIKDHMRTHTGERPFACDICGASFSQRSNLLSHKRATHLDDRRYRCSQCPKRFKRRRLLDYHVKASHTGERPLKCEVCHATFVYPEHYKKHIRIHSGEKPYTCEVCGKSFNSRDNRNTHRFVHSEKKPYECVLCGASYMRKQLLYAHMNTTGHLAESIVINQPKVTKISRNTANTQPVVMNTISVKSDQLSNAIFETSEELELHTDGNKSGESTINLVQTSGESALLTLHEIDGAVKAEGTFLGEVSAEQLVANADGGGMMRLVQVQLADGNDGWVAVGT